MSGRISDSQEDVRSRSPIDNRPSGEQNREKNIVCNPIKTLDEVTKFLNDPPAWRSLCIDLRPHSDEVIRNLDIVQQNRDWKHEIELDRPEAFCHFDLDKEDVKRHRRKSLPRTLVCHDMANGYHDDCYIDGTSNHEAYSFYNWAAVDIFCYFSHHFVTVPPLGWINVGHAHGVKVIGTVITEWKGGASIWTELLADAELWRGFASNLVAIAKTLKFDGWLLNIENEISQPLALVEFVRYLHLLLHNEIPESVLIWYDSVTIQGELFWQNTLNDNNKAYFEACDGIFTNYTWSDKHLSSAKAAAGDRHLDVFVGIDVWGRNFLGGGKFNTQEAVKLVHKHGLSLAIFAPAWTHEALDPAPAWFRTYYLRELALWSSLWPFLNTKLPTQLPFTTSFCTGQGKKKKLYGEVSRPLPWYNLRHQQYQPNSALGPHGYRLSVCPKNMCSESVGAVVMVPTEGDVKPEETPAQTKEDPSQSDTQTTEAEACLQLFLEDSFTGGGCLLINPENSKLIRLFHCDFLIEDTLIVCVVTKTLPNYEEQSLNIVLSVKERNDTDSKVVLGSSSALAVLEQWESRWRAQVATAVSDRWAPWGRARVATAVLELREPRERARVATAVSERWEPRERARVATAVSGTEFKVLQRYLLLNQPGFYVSVENSHGWKVRYFSVPLAGGLVTSVNCCSLERGPILLGHLGLCHKVGNAADLNM